jgi:hypothetical protein
MASTPSLAILLIVSSSSTASNLSNGGSDAGETVQDRDGLELLKNDVEA